MMSFYAGYYTIQSFVRTAEKILYFDFLSLEPLHKNTLKSSENALKKPWKYLENPMFILLGTLKYAFNRGTVYCGVCGRVVSALGYGARGRGFESRRWHMLWYRFFLLRPPVYRAVNRYLAVKRPPCECYIRWSYKGDLGADATYVGSHEVLSLEWSGRWGNNTLWSALSSWKSWKGAI